MIEIALDTGEIASVLDAATAARMQDLVVKSAAEQYVTDTLDYIAGRYAFTVRTGQLEQSISWRPAGGGVTEVYANAEYAAFVEFGTKAHVINPKPGRKGLKISAPGGYVIRRQVRHPGSKAHPFFFADREVRVQHITARALSVIGAYLEVARG